MKRRGSPKPQPAQILRALGRCEASHFRFPGGAVRPAAHPRGEALRVAREGSKLEERQA
jgi:hypothetical protein